MYPSILIKIVLFKSPLIFNKLLKKSLICVHLYLLDFCEYRHFNLDINLCKGDFIRSWCTEVIPLR